MLCMIIPGERDEHVCMMNKTYRWPLVSLVPVALTLNGIAAVGMTLVAMRIVLPPNMSLPGQCLGAKHVPLESLESLESLNSWSLESLESLNSWSLNSWSWGCFSVVRLHVVIAAAASSRRAFFLLRVIQDENDILAIGFGSAGLHSSELASFVPSFAVRRTCGHWSLWSSKNMWSLLNGPSRWRGPQFSTVGV